MRPQVGLCECACVRKRELKAKVRYRAEAVRFFGQKLYITVAYFDSPSRPENCINENGAEWSRSRGKEMQPVWSVTGNLLWRCQ